MNVTLHHKRYGKEGELLSSTLPETLSPGFPPVPYGDIPLSDLPEGIQMTDDIVIKDGVIPHATLKIQFSIYGNKLILEQQMPRPGMLFAPTKSMEIGGESSDATKAVSDSIAREGIRLRRTQTNGVVQETWIFTETPRQKNMALLNMQSTRLLRNRLGELGKTRFSP